MRNKQQMMQQMGGGQNMDPSQLPDEIFKEAKIDIEPVMEFDNVETVKRAVEINAGIAIVPQTTITREEAQGSLKVLKFKNKTFHSKYGNYNLIG